MPDEVQRNLFDDSSGDAYARATDLDTAHAAAESVRGEIAAKLEGVVFAAVLQSGDHGLTWDEAEGATGLDKASISPRWKPLRKLGLIREKRDENGKKVTRPGRSGRNQTVWVSASVPACVAAGNISSPPLLETFA